MTITKPGADKNLLQASWSIIIKTIEETGMSPLAFDPMWARGDTIASCRDKMLVAAATPNIIDHYEVLTGMGMEDILADMVSLIVVGRTYNQFCLNHGVEFGKNNLTDAFFLNEILHNANGLRAFMDNEFSQAENAFDSWNCDNNPDYQEELDVYFNVYGTQEIVENYPEDRKVIVRQAIDFVESGLPEFIQKRFWMLPNSMPTATEFERVVRTDIPLIQPYEWLLSQLISGRRYIDAIETAKRLLSLFAWTAEEKSRLLELQHQAEKTFAKHGKSR